MIHLTQLRRRALTLLALVLAAGACDGTSPNEPLAGADEALVIADPIADVAAAPMAVSLASSSFRGGIPFGVFHLPKEQYGTTFNGSLGNIYPAYLLDYLETARRTGTKVMLSLPSSDQNYLNSNGTFSITKWKQMVDRFRGVNFSSYIKDGTIIGHYILDEPHDPANWAGKYIAPATVDELAKYSKQIWPDMPTIVRSWPKYLKGYKYKYLDAAWAQYSDRFGSPTEFIRSNVSDAKASGLALVVGLNQLAGGSKQGLSGFYSGKYAMAAGELESWGNTLLADSYPCAFISWKYDSKYMGRSDIKSAMSRLAQKARSRPAKSCRGRADGNLEPTPAPPPAPGDDETPPAPDNSSGGTSGAIKLSVSGRAEKSLHRLTLTWSGANSSTVDVYRNGSLIQTTKNDKRYVNLRHFGGRVPAATYLYKVCDRAGSRCSSPVTVAVR